MFSHSWARSVLTAIPLAVLSVIPIKAATLGFVFDADTAVFTIDGAAPVGGTVTTTIVGFNNTSATNNTVTFDVSGIDFDGDNIADSGLFIFEVTSNTGTTVNAGSQAEFGVRSPGEGNGADGRTLQTGESLSFIYDDSNSSITLSRAGYSAESTLFEGFNAQGNNGNTNITGGALVGGNNNITGTGFRTFDTSVTTFGLDGNTPNTNNAHGFGSITANIQILPEPSSILFTSIGSLLLLVHRRRPTHQVA